MHFETPEEFASWLEEHHADRDALWVGYWKKGTGRHSVTWEETVDEALCFGWIDGIRKRIDDDAYTIRFTPRRRGSVWSRRNIDRFAVLSAAGRIREAGKAEYERRREDRSEVYSFEQAKPPELSPDFQVRLQQQPAAWSDWEGRPPGYRRRAAHWVMSAKREATRERRFAALVEDCAAGRKIKLLR